MIGVLLTGFELIASWAISGSDPANLILLGVVYIKLRRNHTDLTDRLDRLETKVNKSTGDS
jgi:uncharacterized membrane protein YciS (DUF1049 family)